MLDVLVLEPDPLARSTLRSILVGVGYNVLEAAGPNEVRRHLAGRDAPLVLVADPALRVFRYSARVNRLLREEPSRGAYVLVAPAPFLLQVAGVVHRHPISTVLLPRPHNDEALLAGVAAAAARMAGIQVGPK